MSEVKSYFGNYADENGSIVGTVKIYLAEDFDRVTAERDAALGREAALREDLSTANGCLNEWRRSTLGRTLLENTALQQRLTAADEQADVLGRDKARIDWLAEQPVDTIYLDDGRIIDIAGRVDLRDAIDAAMAVPTPPDEDDQPDHEPPCSACFARGCNGECMENL